MWHDSHSWDCRERLSLMRKTVFWRFVLTGQLCKWCDNVVEPTDPRCLNAFFLSGSVKNGIPFDIFHHQEHFGIIKHDCFLKLWVKSEKRLFLGSDHHICNQHTQQLQPQSLFQQNQMSPTHVAPISLRVRNAGENWYWMNLFVSRSMTSWISGEKQKEKKGNLRKNQEEDYRKMIM